MKKLFLFLLLVISGLGLSAQKLYGPMVDYRGKASALGRQLYEYLSPGCVDWQFECFFAANPRFFEWEIEKLLKKGIFKMDFFEDSYINTYSALGYLIRMPKVDPKMVDLVGQYYELTVNPYSPDKAQVEYFLIKSSPLWKKKITELLTKRGSSQTVEKIIKEYENRYPCTNLRNVSEIRKTIFDNYMKMFKAGRLAKINNSSSFNDWINYWNINEIIDNMLEDKAVNSKNISAFADFTDCAKEIPDELALKIISYFKLNTSSPIKAPALQRLMGKNPKLNSALSRTLRFQEKSVSKIKLSASYIFSYAQAVGSYDKAFLTFLARKAEYLKGYEMNLEGMDLICWNSAFALLCGKSNLSLQNAARILDKNAGIPNNWTLKPDPKFGKLIKRQNFSPRLSDKPPIAFFFPISSLTPAMQEFALEKYLSIIKNPTWQNRELKKTALENILQLKSEKRRMAVIKILIDSNCRKPLQALSLDYIPELLAVAKGNDPIAAVRACQILCSTGTLGTAAIPGLKELLEKQDDFTVKIAAMCALAEIGGKSGIPLMKKYFNDKNRLLARAAKQAVYILQPVNKSDKFFNEMLKK